MDAEITDVADAVVPVQRVGGHLIGVHLFMVHVVALQVTHQPKVRTSFEHDEIHHGAQAVGILVEVLCA